MRTRRVLTIRHEVFSSRAPGKRKISARETFALSSLTFLKRSPRSRNHKSFHSFLTVTEHGLMSGIRSRVAIYFVVWIFKGNNAPRCTAYTYPTIREDPPAGNFFSIHVSRQSVHMLRSKYLISSGIRRKERNKEREIDRKRSNRISFQTFSLYEDITSRRSHETFSVTFLKLSSNCRCMLLKTWNQQI